MRNRRPRLGGRTEATCVSIGFNLVRKPTRRSGPTLRAQAMAGEAVHDQNSCAPSRAGRPTSRRLKTSGPWCRAIRSSPVARALRRRRARCAHGSAAGPWSAGTTLPGESATHLFHTKVYIGIKPVAGPQDFYGSAATDATRLDQDSSRPLPQNNPSPRRNQASDVGAPVTAAHRYDFDRRLPLAVSVRSLPP